MDESDDEFTELCAKLLRRVKRNVADDNGKTSRRGPQNGSKSTAAQTTSKKPKPAAKIKNQDGTCKRKKGLCQESAGDSEGASTEPGKSDSNAKVAGRSGTLPGEELKAGIPSSALQEGNEQQRPQSDDRNDLLQTALNHTDEWNPEAKCAGAILVQDVQSRGVMVTESGMENLDPKAASVFSGLESTEMAQAKVVKSKGDLETGKADNVRLQMGISSFPVKVVPSHTLEEMAPAECIVHQVALKTSSAAVIGPRAVDRALEKMQKFKRADPRRLKRSAEESSTTPTNGPVLEENQPDNDSNITLSEVENDKALALALQRDTASQNKVKSLEEEGFYFCQLCHKDLSAMNSTLRQQHMNRCLDEVEMSEVPSAASAAPRVPECPICGKQFTTVKSRATHLKRCAVTMQVPPQMLLQAVQMQTMDSEVSGPTVASSAGRTKRKGSSKDSAPPKKHKPNSEISKAEDMLVALVMSRSLLEQESQDGALTVATVKPELTLPIKMIPGAEKKSRKKKKEAPPPPLLIQDPETAIKQIHNRVAALLTEETELPCTPTLPASRFLVMKDLDLEWHYLTSGKGGVLWKCSAMTDIPPIDFFYTKELAPPISPWIAPQTPNDSTDPATQVVVKDTTDEKELRVNAVAKLNQHYGVSSCSQRDQEALQDLMELAGEGITLTQWKLAAEAEQNPLIEVSGKESEASDITPSGFVPSLRESKKMRRSSCHRTPQPLGTLATDFGGMVNNPHLSDVQFQMDCGTILYAHLFVLYARCPLLVELVHDEGFLVEEDGDMRCRRVLLNDVTAEAVCSLLRYLYCASTDISPHFVADVAALSVRFDVNELLAICENNHLGKPMTKEMDSDDEVFSDTKEENEEDNRADNFQELLKSMWVDEEVLTEEEGGNLEEDRSLQENEVDEEELEEIYEFAATQRKVIQDLSEEDTEGGLESEMESSENFMSEMCCAVKNIYATTGTENEKSQESMGIEHLLCAQQPSAGKEVGSQGVTKYPIVKVESEQPSQFTQLKCSKVTEPHTAKSEKSFSPEKDVENTKYMHNSPLPCEGIMKESSKEPLKDSSISQQSCVDLDDSYERMFSDTWGVYLEPSQVDHSKSVMGSQVAEKCGFISSSPDLCNHVQDFLPSENSHCQSPLAGRSISVLPALGLSPESLNPNRMPPLKAEPQSQYSPFKSLELGGNITSPHCGASPQSQSSIIVEHELGSTKTPSKSSPQQPSPFRSPEMSKDKAQKFQSSPYSPCLLSPSPESVQSKTLSLSVSPPSRRSLFSSLESLKNKREGNLFSAEAVTQLKKVVQGIARNYTNRMKQEKATPTMSPSGNLSKQSPNSLITSSSVERQKTSSLAKEKDIIILLDSDEEAELKQATTRSSNNSPCIVKEETSQSANLIGKGNNWQSLKPKDTPVLDFSTEDVLAGPCRETNSAIDTSLNGNSSSKLKLHLSCEDDQSHDGTCSSMETSWLIPATPLLSRSRNSSMQTQTRSFQNISKSSQVFSSHFETTTLDEHSNTLANNLSTNSPEASSVQTFRTSSSEEIFEKNSSHSSFKAPAMPNMSVEESSNKESLSDNTVMRSPTKSLTTPQASLTPHCNDSSSMDHIQPESPCSPTQVIPVEQLLLKQNMESSISEVELSQDSHVAIHLSSSGSMQTDFDLPIPVDECWNVDYLSPPKRDKPEELSFANITNNVGKISDTESCDLKSKTTPIDTTDSRHVSRISFQRNSAKQDSDISSKMAGASQSSKLSFLNSKVWEDWNEDCLPVFSPLSQELSNVTPPEGTSQQQTPVSAIPKRILAPEVPITPLPSYSDMDTPKLKKELDRFGVRPLPKRQMVLKLKEIFMYTHQTMSSDSEEEIPTSQLQARIKSVCLTQPTQGVSAPQRGCSSTETSKKRKPGDSSKPTSDSSSEGPVRTSKQRFKKPSEKKKNTSTAARKKQTANVSPAKSPIKDSLPCITASQESTASSAAGSDVSFESQSSSTNEFETAFASGEEEEEESISLSQAAVKEKDKTEAVRRYLHLNPDLHRKILLYEPIELAGLQAELKQNGIKISTGKLLDFLDTHCITFTTAAARKEKLERKQQKRGKKKVTTKRF
ncbi:structure-specific endonuclease subunit SLX4 isoform X2 [Pleurodeles waltl]|uniref:structure-specific endonuclease subunit SLX4 isoform X2 n=1 Tax=Pleurodeles waltl TaxID=8319 RepID=UPI003709C4FF